MRLLEKYGFNKFTRALENVPKRFIAEKIRSSKMCKFTACAVFILFFQCFYEQLSANENNSPLLRLSQNQEFDIMVIDSGIKNVPRVSESFFSDKTGSGVNDSINIKTEQVKTPVPLNRTASQKNNANNNSSENSIIHIIFSIVIYSFLLWAVIDIALSLDGIAGHLKRLADLREKQYDTELKNSIHNKTFSNDFRENF